MTAPLAAPRELQQMWFSLLHRTWSCVVVVPTTAGGSARPYAGPLMDMAQVYGLGAFQFVDAEGVSLSEGVRLGRDLGARQGDSTRTVVIVDSPAENGGAIPVIVAADAVVLVVELGRSTLESVKNVVDIVGRHRVLGALAV